MPVSLNKSGKISWRSWRLGGYCSRMATLVFDIETSALPLELFDEAQQEYLFREAEKINDPVAKEAKRGEITRFMSRRINHCVFGLQHGAVERRADEQSEVGHPAQRRAREFVCQSDARAGHRFAGGGQLDAQMMDESLNHG